MELAFMPIALITEAPPREYHSRYSITMAAIKILIVVSTKLLRDSPTSYILVSFFGTSFIAAYHLVPKAWISRPCSTIEQFNDFRGVYVLSSPSEPPPIPIIHPALWDTL